MQRFRSTGGPGCVGAAPRDRGSCALQSRRQWRKCPLFDLIKSSNIAQCIGGRRATEVRAPSILVLSISSSPLYRHGPPKITTRQSRALYLHGVQLVLSISSVVLYVSMAYSCRICRVIKLGLPQAEGASHARADRAQHNASVFEEEAMQVCPTFILCGSIYSTNL